MKIPKPVEERALAVWKQALAYITEVREANETVECAWDRLAIKEGAEKKFLRRVERIFKGELE